MKYSVLLLSFFIAINAFSSDTIIVESTPLNPVASSSGSRVKVFEKNDILKKQAITLRDLLEGESLGISFTESGLGGNSSAFFRGVNSNHVLVLLDGVVLNDPTDPGERFDFSYFDLAGIEKVEIYSGSVSSLYGANAIGGVIYLTTKTSGEKKIGLSAGSYSRSGIHFSGATSISDLDVFLLLDKNEKKALSVKGGRGDSWEKDPSTKSSMIFKLSPKLRFKGLSYIYKQDDADVETDGSDGNDETSYVTNKSKMHSVRFDKKSSSIHFSQRSNERESLYNSMTTTFSQFKSLQNTLSIEHHELFGGFDLGTRFDLSKTKAQINNISGEKVLNKAGLGIQAIKQTGSSKLEFGLRTDFFNYDPDSDDISLNSTNYGFGYKTSFGKNILGLRISSGFKAPSLYQLYDGTYGNKDLKPEDSLHKEITLERVLSARFALNLNLYETKIDNLIDLPSDFTPPYKNMGKALIKGVGAELQHFTSLGNVILGLQFIDAKDELTGKRLLSRPDSIISAKHELERGLFNSVTEWIHYGSRISFGDVENSSYDLLHTSLGYRLRNNLQAKLKVRNVLNRNYEEVSGFVSPGRSYLINVDYVF